MEGSDPMQGSTAQHSRSRKADCPQKDYYLLKEAEALGLSVLWA